MTDDNERRAAELVAKYGVRPELEFLPISELCAQVDNAGPRRFLLRGIWPAGDYGVHAAEMKAQKTWNTADLAVSVASGTPWLGAIEVDDPGPVVMLAGEGGQSSIVRRLRAVCAPRGLKLEDLPITVCARAPLLGRADHLYLLQEAVQNGTPRLVTLDPLYLSAGGASGSSLYEMGIMLGRVQQICVPASLWVVTHFNRKEGSGAQRITGAGPAEWGRVLIAASVVSRHTDPATAATTVIARLDVIGGDVPDRSLRVTRWIGADDPDDLDSALHYRVTVEQCTDETAGDERMAPAKKKLLEALRAVAAEEYVASASLVDWIAGRYGHGLSRSTVSKFLNQLEAEGLADSIGDGPARQWAANRPQRPQRPDSTEAPVGELDGRQTVQTVHTPIGVWTVGQFPSASDADGSHGWVPEVYTGDAAG
jgi:hypothetical protein